MSKPLLANSPSVALSLAIDRKLRASMTSSPFVSNALESRDDGLYVGDFVPTGAVIYHSGITGQVFPIYGSTATPSASQLTYAGPIAAAADRDALWDVANPERLTIKRAGRYIVSSYGRYLSVGTYTTFKAWAWIAKNGDEMTPLALHASNTTSPAAQPTINGVGGGLDSVTGSYSCENEVVLAAGDWISTFLLFVSSGTAPVNTITTLTNTPANPLMPTQFMSCALVAE